MTKRATTLHHLASLPQCATWVWTDGSASGGVHDGGAGALVIFTDDQREELRAPAGSLCSSFRAEMTALQTALNFLSAHPGLEDDPIVICTDSRSALAALRAGPSAQTTHIGVAIWRMLTALAGSHEILLQWIPSHCGIPGNEAADALAREAAALPQESAPLDVTSVHRAAARAARAQSVRDWPAGWYRDLMGGHLPPPVTSGSRADAVTIHQLRAGHWSGSAQYLHRIGRNPSPRCPQCSDVRCLAARCPVCGEAADTPRHILIECPALMRTRLLHLGNILPRTEEVRRGDVVAALAAAFSALQSRQATPR